MSLGHREGKFQGEEEGVCGKEALETRVERREGVCREAERKKSLVRRGAHETGQNQRESVGIKFRSSS